MKKTLVVAMLILGSAAVSYAKGSPSRSQVAELLKPQLAKRVKTQKLPLGYWTTDKEGHQALNHNKYCDSTRDMAIVTMLRENGYVTAPALQKSITSTLLCNKETAFLWLASPTNTPGHVLEHPAGHPDVREDIPWETATVATVELLGVSGVTTPTGGMPPGPTVVAQFSYRWKLTQLAENLQDYLAALNQEPLNGLPKVEPKSGQALLVHYDDGWRVERLELP